MVVVVKSATVERRRPNANYHDWIRLGEKRVFQVHGVDAEGRVVVRRKLRRAKVREFFARLAPCLVGMEACGTAHFWARELIAMGHQVKIMPPSYVKAYGAPRRRVSPVEEGSTQRVVD